MRKELYMVIALVISTPGLAASDPWDIFYMNQQVSQGSTVQHRIKFASDGTLYLLEQDYSGSFNNEFLLRIKSYDVTQWAGNNYSTDGWEQIGQVLDINISNNESHIDFVITPENQIFLGMTDSVFRYNPGTDHWESFYVPDYIGGMMCDDNGNILILRSVFDNGEHSFHITRFDNGSIHTLAVIEYDLPWGVTLYPRIMNEANRIRMYNGDYYVSIARASTHENFYFRGNAANGFQMLEQHFNHMNLSSMVISPQGELIISHRGAMSPYNLELKTYDFDLDTWLPFDTTGLHAGFSHANHLMYDHEEHLHLAYNGESGKGFVFVYQNGSWEHLGPRDAIASAIMPNLAFSPGNDLFLVHGVGFSADPLTVRRFSNETTGAGSIAERKQLKIFPNPAKDHFYLNLTGSGSQTGLSIIDLSGQLVFTQSFSEKNLKINTSGMKAGFYTLILKNDEQIQTEKLLIIH